MRKTKVNMFYFKSCTTCLLIKLASGGKVYIKIQTVLVSLELSTASH